MRREEASKQVKPNPRESAPCLVGKEGEYSEGFGGAGAAGTQCWSGAEPRRVVLPGDVARTPEPVRLTLSLVC